MPADKTAVEADLNALKEPDRTKTNPEDMTDAQMDELKAGKEKLMSSAQKLFAKVYEQAQAAAGAAGAGRPGYGIRTAGGSTAGSQRTMMWLTEITKRSNISDII